MGSDGAEVAVFDQAPIRRQSDPSGTCVTTGRGGGNNRGRAVVVTANDGGAAWTPDEGTTWFTLPDVTGFWAVAFASPRAGWLVNGTDGRILKISF